MPIHEKSLIRPENLKTHDELVIDGVDVSGHWSTFIEARVVTDYNEALQDEIAALPGGEQIHRCWQCGSCTNSCTVNAINPDFNPRYWIYLIRMGMESELLRDKDIIWQCVSCNKCTYACPRDVFPEGVMKATSHWLELKGHTPKSPSMHFDEVFTEQIVKTGKIEESRTIRRFFQRTGQALVQDWMIEMVKRMLRHLPVGMLMRMGLATFVAPRTSNWSAASKAMQEYIDEQEHERAEAPNRTSPPEEPIPMTTKEKYKKVAYYPGCALEGTGHSYNRSTKAVGKALGLDLVEVKNWNCCGAMEVKNVDPKLQTYLSSRVMSVAANEMDMDVVMAPCNGCYHNLKKAEYDLANDKESVEVVDKLSKKAGHKTYESGQVETIHALDWIKEAIGEDGLRERVKNSLSGIKVANYYGCMYTRPRHIFPEKDQGPGSESTSKPHFMDDLLAAAGAENVDFPLKTACCGGAHTLSDSDTSTKLVLNILKAAKMAGADVIATECPTCHSGLEMHQIRAEKTLGEKVDIKILYFTQLLGMALGLKARKVGVHENISDSIRFLKEKGLA